MSDHERIWLQNAEDARATGDRLWCQDKVWPECDEQQDAELERLRREVEEAKEFRAILEGHLSAAIDDYNDALGALRNICTAIEREPIVGDLDYPHAHNDWRGWRKKVLRPAAEKARALLGGE